MTLTELRTLHPALVYQSVDVARDGEDVVLKFQYTLLPDKHLTTTTTLRGLGSALTDENMPIVKNMAFHLGIVEALSYWKLACPVVIDVQAGHLSSEQIAFWDALLRKGLSEFFFINKIDGWQEGFVSWKSIESTSADVLDTATHANKSLLPIGGGKDSMVSLEVLREAQLECSSLSINQTPQVAELLKTAAFGNTVHVTRVLDPQFAELNATGYLNGHTPFSAMAAFLSVIVAYLGNFSKIVLSNEWSANEGNTIFMGQVINHQYSKSLEFELAFREYCRHSLSTSIEYFSLLRPWHELQIAQIFSHFPEYFPKFLSCNRGQKTGHWCGECPKCLFAALILSPFLHPKELQGIFGQDLLNKASLLPIFEELVGLVEVKSFECVGTREESRMAIALAMEKWYAENPPLLFQHAASHFGNEFDALRAQAPTFLNAWQEPNALPPEFAEAVRELQRKYAST